jgi:phage portal protein BeeE
MRNPRTWRLYGYSPVEQIITTVNIALRRQVNQLQFYTEGNVPSALIAAPTDWTPDMIAQMQDWWDDQILNAPKAKAKFIPGGTSFIDTKQALMGPADKEINEWLARVVCFAFSISPTQLVSTNNRATSDSQKEQADDEGLKPTKRWLKQLIDELVVRYFGWADIEFDWITDKEIDALKAAQIAQIYLTTGVMTPDEVRAELGMEALTDEQKEEMAANKPQPPMMHPANEDDAAPGQDKPPSGKAPKAEADEPKKADQIHIHMPEIKTGDTLVEIGGTVVKVEQAGGKVTETRIDGRS